jgi:LmbE family N-acetylglucosaminyl deacetylase
LKIVMSLSTMGIVLFCAFLGMWTIEASYKGEFTNSMFSVSALQGKTVMIIVPHEDDELNVAGVTIKNLRDNGIRTICVFATNGDCYPVEKRISEARESLHILGVEDSDIYFLGYADGPASQAYYDKYTAPADKVLISPKTGKKETYCVLEKQDCSTQFRGKPNPYTRSSYKSDMQYIILRFKPDIIFANDFDKHLNHRENSLLFEEVMGDILKRPGNNYYPEVFKGFAYSTAYTAVADFYVPNILSTQKPDKTELNNPAYETDIPQYEWDKRVRLPSNKACLTRTLEGNTLFAALAAHKSQDTLERAARIINGDQVFWQRDTNSLTYQGLIEVSSGKGNKLNDFKLVDVTDLHPRHITFANYLWTPSLYDKQKMAMVMWQQGQTIDKIVLYGNIEEDSRIEAAVIELSNGFKVQVQELNCAGRATIINIPTQEKVNWLKFTITKWRGKKPGLAELEIYGGNSRPSLFNLVKITINEDFAYDYWVKENIKEVVLGIYKFGNVGECKLSIVEGEGRLQGNTLFLDGNYVIVRAEGDNNVFDQIVIRRKNFLAFWKLKLRQVLEKKKLKL